MRYQYKRRHMARLTISLLGVCLLGFNVVQAQEKKMHPFLFYTPQRTSILKERIKTDTGLANNWNALKDRCDQWLTKPKVGDMEQLALAYAMTGNGRYAERAKSLLDDVVNRKEWDGMDDREPRWNSGLGTSHSNWVTAVTYDAIYNTLSATEKGEIAQKIVKLGIEPSIGDWLSKDKRIQSLNNMGHNWWSAIVFEAGIASLAVMNDVPEAREWARSIMDDSPEWFGFSGSVLENKPSTFDPDGGFYESIGYANYGVSEYLLFRLAYTNALKPVKMPYDGLLQRTADWFLHAGYPRSAGPLMSLNFGDSNDYANGDKPIKLLIALGLGKADYSWYLSYTAKKNWREDLNISTPMGMLYEPDNRHAASIPSLPTSSIYTGLGWGMLRSSWKPDATLLGVKCGFTWNHAHADAGSFVLYHNGQNLLIDGGDVNYARPEYSSYFVTSRAHNVLMFNGEAQDNQDEYHAVKNSGHLYHMIDGDKLKYIMADVTGPTSKNFLRNYRNFLWIGNVILIIDDVKTYDIGKLDFLLHYADTAVKRGPDLEITREKAGILFRPLYPETLPLGYPHDFPEKMKLNVDYGIKDRTFDVKIPYYVISPPEKTDRTKFINAIILLNDGNQQVQTFTGSSGANASSGRTNIPVIEKFQGNDYLGIRITQNGQVSEVYINLLADGRLMHRNSSNEINGWETDAYLSAVTFPVGADRNDPTKLSSVFISNGSYLRKGGQVLLSSLSKVFLYADKEDNVLKVQIQGQPLIRASLGIKGVKRIFINDQASTPKYDAQKFLSITVNGLK
ncbi:MAG: hypothetical protein JWR38_2802 [Mucilaginibacter sp.]|nr:hypothetical protein [Mucilaginibacter sp.]